MNLPNTMNWEKYGYVLASKYRIIVSILLLESPKTPTQIQKKTKVAISHISRALNELLAKEIVKCLNPNAIKGRIYNLSEEGREIVKEVQKNLKSV